MTKTRKNYKRTKKTRRKLKHGGVSQQRYSSSPPNYYTPPQNYFRTTQKYPVSVPTPRKRTRRTFKKVVPNRFAPKFNPKSWNSFPKDPNDIYGKDGWAGLGRQRSHNCYTYFLNLHNKETQDLCIDRLLTTNKKTCGKPQPGYASGKYNRITDYKDYNCPVLDKRILADNPYIKRTTRDAVCPAGYYKGALVVTDKPGRNGTYHFYRQDADGYWSHKDGGRRATKYDAAGQLIRDVETANKKYKNVDYNIVCNNYCIPSDPKKKRMSIRPTKGWTNSNVFNSAQSNVPI